MYLGMGITRRQTFTKYTTPKNTQKLYGRGVSHQQFCYQLANAYIEYHRLDGKQAKQSYIYIYTQIVKSD